jgi:hypothetical protein
MVLPQMLEVVLLVLPKRTLPDTGNVGLLYFQCTMAEPVPPSAVMEPRPGIEMKSSYVYGFGFGYVLALALESTMLKFEVKLITSLPRASWYPPAVLVI